MVSQLQGNQLETWEQYLKTVMCLTQHNPLQQDGDVNYNRHHVVELGSYCYLLLNSTIKTLSLNYNLTIIFYSILV